MLIQTALSLALIVFIPVLLIYVLALLEPFAVTRLKWIAVSAAWGALSYGVAAVIQGAEREAQTYVLSITLVSAPFLEEALKLAFLLFLYNRTLARYSGDALVYGFAVGSGFAILESAAYVFGQADPNFGGVLTRIVSTGLFHASLSAIMGTAVGGVLYRRRWLTYPFFAVIYLFAVILHHLFNIYALLEAVVGDVQTAIFIGLSSLFIVLGLQYFNRARERQRILREAASALEAVEQLVVRQGSALLTALEGQAARLGEAQSDHLRAYLLTSAESALLTHHVERGHRPNIHQLRADRDQLRARADQILQELDPPARAWLAEQISRSTA